jgi:hypothetical protein
MKEKSGVIETAKNGGKNGENINENEIIAKWQRNIGASKWRNEYGENIKMKEI